MEQMGLAPSSWGLTVRQGSFSLSYQSTSLWAGPSSPPNFLFFSPVAELHLEGNYLYRLPNEVSSLQHLKTIDLSRNQFQDFPEQLTTLPALETINLEENEIVGECDHSSLRLCGERESTGLYSLWAQGRLEFAGPRHLSLRR